MLDLFAPIKCLLREESVCIDNVVFRLHSRVTVLLLVVCTILVTAKQYIGEPISCMTDGSIGMNFINLQRVLRIYIFLCCVTGRQCESINHDAAFLNITLEYRKNKVAKIFQYFIINCPWAEIVSQIQ